MFKRTIAALLILAATLCLAVQADPMAYLLVCLRHRYRDHAN